MIGIVKGLATTFGHLLRPAFTARYPEVPKVLPPRSRSSFALVLDEDGVPRCKACLLCANSCPDAAITVESVKRPDGPGRMLTRFAIDLGLCMYCGICVEHCAAEGLVHTTEFENACTRREDTLLVLYERDTPDPLEEPGAPANHTSAEGGST